MKPSILSCSLIDEVVDDEVTFNHRYRILNEQYEQLKTEFNELKLDHKNLVTLFNTHIETCKPPQVVRSEDAVKAAVISTEKPAEKPISPQSKDAADSFEKLTEKTVSPLSEEKLAEPMKHVEKTPNSLKFPASDETNKTILNRKHQYEKYVEKRKKIDVRFPSQGCVTSLLVMASNGKFLNPDLLSEKGRGVAILRVATAEEALAKILLFKELFPRIVLDRIVISLGTNDLDHVISDFVVVKRLENLKSSIHSFYKDANITIMCLLPRGDRDVDMLNCDILAKIENSHLFENIDHSHLYDCKHIAKRFIGKLANNLKLHLHGKSIFLTTAKAETSFRPPTPRMPSKISHDFPTPRMPNKIPHDFSTPRMPSKIPHDFPNGMPSKIPHDFPNGMPSKMPHDFPNGMPSKMPHDFPNGFPPLRTSTQSYASAVSHGTRNMPAIDSKNEVLNSILNLLTSYVC